MVRMSVLIAVIMLVLTAIPAESGSTDLGDALHIDWTPDPLRLLEGAEGTVHMDVRNLANVTMRVGFVYMVIRAAGSSGGSITPDLIELQPGETQRVDVRIHSYGGSLTHPEVSDGRIRVYWGPNITRDAASWPPLKGWVDFEEAVLPVSTVSSYMLAFVAAVVVVVVTVILVAYLVRRRGRSPVGHGVAPPRGR